MSSRILILLHLKQMLLRLALAFGLAWPALSLADDAQLSIHNRSSYKVFFQMWKNGKNCSDKLNLPAEFNINNPQPQTATVPANSLIAAGIAIFDVGDQAPVACDYILSFKLAPGGKYNLDFDIHDRRCYGQLYEQQASGVSRLILPGEGADLSERITILGWDMSEPGCEE